MKWSVKPYTRYIVAGGAAALVSLVIYVAIQWISAREPVTSETVLNNSAQAQNPEPGLSQLKKTSESFRSIAKKVGPAVVNIRATTSSKEKRRTLRRGRRPQPQQEEDELSQDPFFDFFEKFGQPFPFDPHGGGEMPQTSLGSGIIIDPKGYVVTNHHVVREGGDITLILSDEKSKYKAKVVGSDARSDIAVLKIEKGGTFPFIEWADSDAVEVGDWAIAIGSPFALGQTVTVGIVSAKGRSTEGVGAELANADLIQTDAAINPGNSGGPLVDLEGRVMGVNEAIYTRSGGYMGIGFAIPSNLVKDVAQKLMKDGKIERGWLGVYIQPLGEEFAKKLGTEHGVRIHEVVENGPAAKAGIEAGDVILEVNGNKVTKIAQVQRFVGDFKPGQAVPIKILAREGKKQKTVSVKLGDMPNDEEAVTGPSKDDEPDKLGVIVGPAKAKEGVVVQYVQPGSVAEQSGIQVGDIIETVNDKKVSNPSTYQKQIKNAKELELLVRRKGRTLSFQFSLPQ